MHAFLGLDMMRAAFLHQVYCHAFRPETMCSEKKKGKGGTIPREITHQNAPAIPGNADIRDSEGEGMNLISVPHASHGSPC